MKQNSIRIVVPVVVSMLCMAAVGAGMTREERMALKEKKYAMMEKYAGGALLRPGSVKGEIVYVNCQKRIPEAWIRDSIAYFVSETGFKISMKEGKFQFPSPTIVGNASLFVIDDEKMPPMLVAPESRWAMVNIAAVAKEKRPAFFEARAKKELTRGFSYLCGAANSQYIRSLTRGIVNHADLDVNPDYDLPVDVVRRFAPYMETLGVTPAVYVTYKQACEEGWAKAPTNAVQKTIWDDVKAAKTKTPTKPIKISK